MIGFAAPAEPHELIGLGKMLGISQWTAYLVEILFSGAAFSGLFKLVQARYGWKAARERAEQAERTVDEQKYKALVVTYDECREAYAKLLISSANERLVLLETITKERNQASDTIGELGRKVRALEHDVAALKQA